MPPRAKSWLIGKDPDAGRDWGQEEKGTTEDEMAGCHHRLDGPESGWTPGVGDGQGGLACCDSRGRKKSDMTERLNWTELNATNRICWKHKAHCHDTLYMVFRVSLFDSWDSWLSHSYYKDQYLGQCLPHSNFSKSLFFFFWWLLLLLMISFFTIMSIIARRFWLPVTEKPTQISLNNFLKCYIIGKSRDKGK